MNPENLKLYNKYKYGNIPDKELIYIGIDKYNYYWFIYKNKNYNINIKRLNDYGLNSEEIIKNLNLEIFIDNNDDKYVEGYDGYWFSEKNIINLKPILKDKLKNIINR